MRRPLIPILSLLLAVAAFATYWKLQENHELRFLQTDEASGKLRATVPTTAEYGLTKRPYIRTVKNQQVVSEFRAEDSDPQNDGTIKVTFPELIFHGDQGRKVRITGKRGTLYTDSASAPKGMAALTGAAASPTGGQFSDVTVEVHSGSAELADLTIRMNNATFNLQTLRVYTESYEDPQTSQKVPADEVPVTVRGEDMDFDGQGLMLQWNDRDKRLQSLEIAHGGKAVLKRAAALALPLAAATSQPSSTEKSPQMPAESPPATQPQQANLSPPASHVVSPATTRAASESVIYRATFDDNVRVTQGAETRVTAEQMLVDYFPSNGPEKKTTGPTSVPTAPTAPDHAVAPPSIAATSPTTAPASPPPVVLTWIGPLRIVPLDAAPLAPIASGESAVRFVGGPLVISQHGMKVVASTVTYQTSQKHAVIVGSSDHPIVTLQGERGLNIESESIEYSADLAIITGRSRATIPSEKSKQTLTASWTRRGEFHLRKSDNQTVIESADLSGDVKIDHPQLNLASRTLAMEFDPAGEKAASPVRHILAQGDVVCHMFDSKQGDQHIQSQRLEADLATSDDGKPFARSVTADGAVVAVSGEQEFSAEHISMAMSGGKATTQPLASVQTLHATKNVRAKLRGGLAAVADEVKINDVGDEQVIELLGQPDARIADATGNTIRSALLQIYPNTGRGRVPGPGTMYLLQPGKGKKPPVPVDVSWTGELVFDSKSGTINLNGDINFKSTDTDGSVRTGTCKEMLIILTDAPATKPAGANDLFIGGSRRVKQIVMQKHAQLESLHLAADGSIIRRMAVLAEKMLIDPVARNFEVPEAGEMLIENHSKTPSKVPGGGMGTTAFSWKDRLVYVDSIHQANMEGGVVMQHRPDKKAANATDMTCSKLIMEFLDKPRKGEEIGVKRVIAKGPVTLINSQLDFDASSLEYNPETQLLIARGTESAPAKLRNLQGLSTGSFLELTWNVAKETLQGPMKGAKLESRR